VIGGVHRAETDIVIRAGSLKPGRAIAGEGTVDDMRDGALTDELGGQEGSRSDENASVEVSRRLAKIVWNRGQHLLLARDLSFNDHTRELHRQRLHTIQRCVPSLRDTDRRAEPECD